MRATYALVAPQPYIDRFFVEAPVLVHVLSGHKPSRTSVSLVWKRYPDIIRRCPLLSRYVREGMHEFFETVPFQFSAGLTGLPAVGTI